MSGWFSVAIIATAQIAAALFLVRLVARRWWDYLVIAVLTAGLIRPAARYITGDISRYLPDAIWSDGSGGKDQIVIASAASTLLAPLVASAVAIYLVKRAWRALADAKGHGG